MRIKGNAPAQTRASSNATTSASRHSTTSALPFWLVSLPTMAPCIVSLAAPMAAALAGLIARGQL